MDNCIDEILSGVFNSVGNPSHIDWNGVANSNSFEPPHSGPLLSIWDNINSGAGGLPYRTERFLMTRTGIVKLTQAVRDVS